jgi:hypothetical protein
VKRARNIWHEAFQQGRLWTPALWRTAAWFDAADLSTVRVINTRVFEWRDKSGFGRHVSVPQGLTTFAPTLRQNVLNGLPAIDWGAAINNFGLQRQTGLGAYNPTRYLIVAHYEGPNPFNEFAGLVSHTPFGVVADLLSTNTGSTVWYTGTYFHNGNPTATNVALPTISQPFVVASNFAQGSNRTGLFVGNDRFLTGLSRGWRGKIMEVVGIDFTWSEAERQRAEGYAAWKWGTALDPRHPYVNRPPMIGD